MGKSVLFNCVCGNYCRDCCVQLLAHSPRSYHTAVCPACNKESDIVNLNGRQLAFQEENALIEAAFLDLLGCKVVDLEESCFISAFRELNDRIEDERWNSLRELFMDAPELIFKGQSEEQLAAKSFCHLKLTLARAQSVIQSKEKIEHGDFVYGPLRHIHFRGNVYLEQLISLSRENERIRMEKDAR